MAGNITELRVTNSIVSGIATYLPGATFGPRKIKGWEFIWIIEGDAEYQRARQKLTAPAGSVMLCGPGEEDFFQWDRWHRTRQAYFHFEIQLLPKAWPAIESWPLIRLPQEGDILRPLFRQILAWGNRGDELMQKLMVMHLLGAYVTGQTAGEGYQSGSNSESVDKALSYIRKQLDKDLAANIRLGDLARIADITPEHLCRLFKSATGHTPSETVRLAKLDHSAVLLARSNYAIGEIARMCGFSSPFHFSRCFKEAFGSSPRKLRQKIEAGDPMPKSLLDH